MQPYLSTQGIYYRQVRIQFGGLEAGVREQSI